jgi:hypothetical protein
MEPTVDPGKAQALAAAAWNDTKDEADPVFVDCALDHKNRLIYEAGCVARGGAATSVFERRVAEIIASQETGPVEEEPAVEVAETDIAADDAAESVN